MGYEHLEVVAGWAGGDGLAERPEKLNAMSRDMWDDLPMAVGELNADESVRVVVLAGRGPSFTAGIDLGMLASFQGSGRSPAESNQRLFEEIQRLQWTSTCLAESPKPVIASVHGHCFGAGMGLITACDVRLAAADSVFSIRETRIAIVADVGTLQRLPAIVGAGHTAELALTGAEIDAGRALDIGLVNSVHPDSESTDSAAMAGSADGGELSAGVSRDQDCAGRQSGTHRRRGTRLRGAMEFRATDVKRPDGGARRLRREAASQFHGQLIGTNGSR